MKRCFLFCLLVLACMGLQSNIAVASNVLAPQAGVGAQYASRDPYQCVSEKEPTSGPISPELAAQYFICGFEKINGAGNLMLATNVHVQVGSALTTNQKIDESLDENEPAYPILGSYDQYLCTSVREDPAGSNCTVWHMNNATGTCSRNNIGNWTCGMVPPTTPAQISNQPAPGAQSSLQSAPNAQNPNQPAQKWSVPGLASAIAAARPNAMAARPAVMQVAAAQPNPISSQLQIGMQSFSQGNYPAAYQTFQGILQTNPLDPTARMWFGVSRAALKRPFADEYFLNGSDSRLGGPSDELLALYDWSQGKIEDAKTVLNTCQKYLDVTTAGKCADMLHGIESGASAPDVSNWPADVGLTTLTTAVQTVWAPSK